MKRGALIYLLIVFLLLNLTGCGANSVSAPSQKENDQEGESHYEENSQQEAGLLEPLLSLPALLWKKKS